ncbi:lipid II-degrading bacteriocin [Pseudomonas aeruginosa]|nr:lipid II-degrading bacteriocin [Pseudomonas aeruginosa]
MPMEFPPTTVIGRPPFATPFPLSFSGLSSTGWGHNGELAGHGPAPVDESDVYWDLVAPEGPYHLWYNQTLLKSLENYIKSRTGYTPSLYNAYFLDLAVNKQNPLLALYNTSELIIDWSKIHQPQKEWYTLKEVTQNAFFQSKAIGLAMAHDFLLWKEESNVNNSQYRVQEVFDNGGRDILIDEKLAANPYSYGKALFHYIYGKGAPLHMNVPDIGIKLTPQDIQPLRDMIKMSHTPTTRPVHVERLSYWTGRISNDVKYTLGNITLKVTGQFQRFTDSRWKFTGTVKVWDDVYDANLDFQRPMDEQTATRFLAELKNYGATNFDIKMYGEAPIELSGTGDKL